ncbi:sugar transporter [Spirochaetia bacterium]|nr:sugar transporter [Spirochaetia bacterium]
MLFTVLGFWSINFLTDTVGLAAALAGAAVMLSTIWDAVTDPVMGYVSDRTHSRWGRRRPYLLFGALPMMLSLWFFFTSPDYFGQSSQSFLFMWAALALMLVKTASTILNIPYSSLTPELTDDYHERSTLNGYRFGFAVFGTMLGAAAVQPIVDTVKNKLAAGHNVSITDPAAAEQLMQYQKTGFSVLGLILGAVFAVVSLLCFFGTKEKTRNIVMPKEGFFPTYRAVFRNRPFVILFCTYALHIVALTFLQSILVYYTEYVYQKPEMTTLAMLMLLVTAMVFIPVSVLVSKKIGKKFTYQICFAILGSACLLIFFLGHILGPNFFLAMMVYGGIGIGFNYVAPFAMVPDTIEYDAVKTGERKEGAYYGMWTFISKLGAALAAFLLGIILSVGAYVPHAVQSDSAILAIRIIIGPLPALIFCAAIILVQRYPLDEKTFNELIKGK